MRETLTVSARHPLYGYRGWLLEKNRWLYSNAYLFSARWHAREALSATCHMGHRAPYEPCDCGVYAFEGTNGFQHYYKVPHFVLYGKIKLWGTVVRCSRHDDGVIMYRAEHAQPIEFYKWGNRISPKHLAQLAKRYRCRISSDPVPVGAMEQTFIQNIGITITAGTNVTITAP